MQTLMSEEQPRPAAPSSGGGNLALALAGLGLALIALIGAIVLFMQLRQSQADLAALQKRVADLDTNEQQHAKDLRLGIAAVKAQTAEVGERVGVTAAELEKTASAAQKLAEQQKKGQEQLSSLGGEVGKVKDDVATSKAAIEQTQAQLQHAIGDLGEQSGLIARNAAELDQLKKSGLRDYADFDLRKSKQPTPVGAVAIRLISTDPKKHKFSMMLVVDDISIEKKDKTLLEPVQFYRKGSRALNELVVFTIDKDHIIGYLSAPKAGEAQ